MVEGAAALVQQGFPGSQASASDASALVKAFLKGAGLEALPAEAMTPELMETVGRLISISAQGMVDLLAGRAAVKQEVHLSVTLINPKSNNPLKFLPDGRTALLQMLGPKMPGFMPAVEAMEEAIQDMVTHQTAIAAGTQATIEALFRRFDLATLEVSHSQLGMGEKVSRTLHRARLWSLYVAQYAQIREKVKDRVLSLFMVLNVLRRIFRWCGSFSGGMWWLWIGLILSILSLRVRRRWGLSQISIRTRQSKGLESITYI